MQQLELSKYYIQKNDNELIFEDIQILTDILKYHSDLYYNKESPIISDFEYDNLFKKLQLLEQRFNIDEKEIFWVWSDVSSSSFSKVKHSRPMISLDNTYNETDLKDFDERIKKILDQKFFDIEYILEFKFDWLWVELIYDNWELIQAITRWNWIEWEDVTLNVKTIKNIPKNIDYKEHLEIRWEVVMPISAFEEYNENAIKLWQKVFSNPRNAASWSLRLLDYSETQKRNLKFFAYDIANMQEYVNNQIYISNSLFKFASSNNKSSSSNSFSWREKENQKCPSTSGEGLGVRTKTYFETIISLKNMWFEISSYFKKAKNINEIINFIENFGDVKNTIDFDIDWLVLKTNDLSLWQDIGFTAHHPRYAIAYKFPAEILTTRILSVEHQVWRTWTITPVANLEPISIWWVIVKRATLHNYDEIKNLKIKVWSNVFIKRAWEVIPKIIWLAEEIPPPSGTPFNKGREKEEDKKDLSLDFSFNIPNSPFFKGGQGGLKEITPPEFCPSCGVTLLKDDDKVRFYCPNHLNCREQVKQKIINSVWKWWLNIDWLWSEQVELFLEKWFINDLSDIFELENKKDLILALPWYKEKSVNNLLNAINNAKNQDIVNFLVALNIFGIWKQSAKELSKIINSWDDLLNFNVSVESLALLKDIWEETAKNIYNYFNNILNKELLNKLSKHINITFKQEVNSWKYFWKKVCITWSFENYSRDDLIKMLENNWWSFVSSVSKNTDFLLAWEKAWSKLQKATELWIKILTLEEFLL